MSGLGEIDRPRKWEQLLYVLTVREHISIGVIDTSY